MKKYCLIMLIFCGMICGCDTSAGRGKPDKSTNTVDIDKNTMDIDKNTVDINENMVDIDANTTDKTMPSGGWK